MSLRFSYEMHPNPPPAMGWEEYESHVSKAWDVCLAAASSEGEVQRFLEEYPCLVPGGPGWENTEGVGHHQPYQNTLISQPPLNGPISRIPDFMWMTWDSATVRPVLIEIEKPTKKWFTKKGQPTADLTQARTQLDDWRVWLNKNETGFREKYRLDDVTYGGKAFVPRFILVYGRRSEAADNPLANERRGLSDHAGTTSMTYDRLTPKYEARCAITVSCSGSGKPKVMHVPPTFVVGPHVAEALIANTGWERAINHSSLMSEKRKDFLLERIRYWSEWARDNSTMKIMAGNAFE